ncbi:hypothetical protein GINT2_001051 [Glugoides intestinalis]
MFETILKSDKSHSEKIDELRKIVSSPVFLKVLVDPSDFLREILPFAKSIFQELPPDSLMTFGPSNDMRVFFIRLFSKLKYSNYADPQIMEMVYALIATENIFNRYLSLRILFPLLDSAIQLNLRDHLACLGSFFKNELPIADGMDGSRYEIGFFAVAEAFNYLRLFQLKYNLPPDYYDEIFLSITGAFRLYFTQGLVEKFCTSKKVVCEFCSMGVNMISFLNIVNALQNNFMSALIPELCYTLANISPTDCHFLKKGILAIILETLASRKPISHNLDRYFLKNPYLLTDSPVLIIENLSFLSTILSQYNSNMSKIVYFEFDQRICEYLPTRRSIQVIYACISAFISNLSTAIKGPTDNSDFRALTFKQIKNASRIYKLLHLAPIILSKSDVTNELPSKPSSNSHFTDESLSLLFIDYIKVLIKSLTLSQLQKTSLDREHIIILANLLLFPLTRELPCQDLITTFTEMNVECLEMIVLCAVDSLFLKYHSQVSTWSLLQAVPEINCILIKTANTLIHHDVTTAHFRSLDFYSRALPLAYSFFKLDKKYIRSEFSEYFSVIYDYLLHLPLSSNGAAHTLTFRDAAILINSMFIEVKTCEVAYTGLYFIYNYFEASARELYTAYTFTFDPFYLECLFNIPVSLNLLVTKYSVLLSPMAAGLRSCRATRDIVLKYIEYIIEFDEEDGYMSNILLDIYDLLQTYGGADTCYSKAINVFSRLSNKHRTIMTVGTLRGHRLMDTNKICTPIILSQEEPGNKRYVEDNKYTVEEIEDILRMGSYRIQEADTTVNIPSEKLRRMCLPLLIGFEFTYETNMRQNAYHGSPSRVLRMCTFDPVMSNPNFKETIRDSLITHLLDVLKLGSTFLDSTEVLKQTSLFRVSKSCNVPLVDLNTVYQTVTDILFSFLLYEETNTRDKKALVFVQHFVLDYSLIADQRILSDFIPDGLVYAPNTTFMLLTFMRDNLDSAVLFGVLFRAVSILIDFVYSQDDLKSSRAVEALLRLVEKGFFTLVLLQEYPSQSIEMDGILFDLFSSIFHKLRRCNSFRIYELCFETIKAVLLSTGGDGLALFSGLLERPIGASYSYLKALSVELAFLFDLHCPIEQLPEMDRRCVLRILALSREFLLKIHNLSAVAENLLRGIEKKDTCAIEQYLLFIHKMKSNNNLFNELLAPAKKYLPTIAVLEGFSSSEARRKFVENVNRNGNFQSQNPGSFRIFRNLFFNCCIASNIKTNFVEVYASQSPEHRATILEILLNCLEYDLPSFEFLITRLSEQPLAANDRLTGQSIQGQAILETLASRLYEQSRGVRHGLLLYLIEHMHNDFIYEFVDLCVQIENEITAILTNFLNDFLNSNHPYREQLLLSKAAYNILRYLKKRKCRFNDNKAVLLVYRDLYGVETEIEELVNWYFKNFTSEDIELLYRINNGFVITSESLLVKLITVESTSTRTWMLQCLRKQCTDEDQEFLERCISFYLKSKGVPVFESIEQNAFKMMRRGEDELNLPENNTEATTTAFSFEGVEIESSETDMSLFYDISNESDQQSIKYDINHSVKSNSAFNNNSAFNKKALNTNLNIPLNNNRNNNNFNHYNRLQDDNINSKKYNIDLNLSFILPYFSDSLHLIIELFCDLKLFSKDLLDRCRDIIHGNVQFRFAALFYLCLFDPRPEYLEYVFKLNYQERKYVSETLQLLLKKTCLENFTVQIKTVLRSEMRFKTTEHIIIPFVCANRQLLESPDIFFELAVFAHRLVRTGNIVPDLIDAVSGQFPDFDFDLNTMVLQWEIKHDCQISRWCPNYNRNATADLKKPQVLLLVEKDLETGNSDTINGNGFSRESITELVKNTPGVVLSASLIRWLSAAPSSLLSSSPVSQLVLLELFCSNHNFFFIDNLTIVSLLQNIIASRLPFIERVRAILPLLIKHSPDHLCDIFSNSIIDNEFCYPPLFDSLPVLFEVCSPETGVTLCQRRPSNLPIEVIELNTLHLFKVFPSSIDLLRTELFNGLLSKNRISRMCYLDLLFAQVPSGIFNILQFILLFNYEGLSDSHIDYFIAVLLCFGTRLNIIPGGSLWDALYFSPDRLAVIEALLVGVFDSLATENLSHLFKIYSNSFDRSLRIKIPFIRAFIASGVPVDDLYYNPFNASLFYYSLMDREMYLGMIKSTGGIREVRVLTSEQNETALLTNSMDLLKKVECRLASYNMNDVCFLEKEITRIYAENNVFIPPAEALPIRSSGSVVVEFDPDNSRITTNSFISQLEKCSSFEIIEQRIIRIIENINADRNLLDDVKSLVNSLSLMFHLPRNTAIFSRLLLFCSLTSEIIESSIIIKDNLVESIYGRFRMWMGRHPSFYGPLVDWNLFVKWRTFVFTRSLGIVSENDKKKISSELCRLNCIYATKLFKERLYPRVCAVLNEVSSITTVEINQNMQRILLDLESLFKLGDYTTMTSLIGSLNIAKFSNEEKSRLYYWAYKALKRMGKTADAEKYGTLSRKLFDIIENKKDDLELLKERLQARDKQALSPLDDNFTSSGFFNLFSPSASQDLENAYTAKLIEIINELGVGECRTFVLELLSIPHVSTSDLENISHQKLYFFIPQLKSIDFLLVKNPLLRSCLESVNIFDSLVCGPSATSLTKQRLKLKQLLDNSGNPEEIKAIANEVFESTLNSLLAIHPGFPIHFFEKETPLLGSFTGLRSKYDDLVMMEYIEASINQFDQNDQYPNSYCCLFIRTSDGSLSRVIPHFNTSHSSKLIQFMELLSHSNNHILQKHSLQKNGFRLLFAPTVTSSLACYSIHSSIASSLDSFFLFNLFKNSLPLHSIISSFTDHIRSVKDLPLFCDTALRWNKTLKMELIDLFPNYNDFYTFKRNFIDSYGSIICLQHLLGICSIDHQSLFIDQSGNAILSCIKDSKRKFFFRPALQSLFGNEGINGPLSTLLLEFIKASDSECVLNMALAFGIPDLNISSIKEVSSISLLIGEMVDPKNGLTLPTSEMAWL